MTGYPRDLVGYADQPPDPRWPDGARLALNFVVNYEEGGERSVLHGDKVAETRLTDRLMRVFAERQVIPTIYAVGMALERNPPRRWRVRAATSSITGGAGSTITASTKQPSESISASPSRPFGG